MIACCLPAAEIRLPFWSVAVVLALLVPVQVSVADFPAGKAEADAAQIASLIRDLGSDRFQIREAASDRLARIGLPAFAALEEATRHTDREIRFRAERILILIRKNDLERRLAAFLASAGRTDYDLPAWSRFAKTYGDAEASRHLFVEMQRAEPELLAALHRDPRAAAEVLGRRLTERFVQPVRGVNVNMLPVSSGEISAYLFVAAQEDADVSSNSMNVLLTVCNQSAFLESLRAPKKGELNKKMLAGMIVRGKAESSYPAIRIALELGMKEGLVPAVKLLEEHGKMKANSPIYAAMALACVAEMGDASHVSVVEKLLGDQSLLTSSVNRLVNNGQTVAQTRELQVRDAALATLVVLTKQDAREYYGQPLPPLPASSLANPFNRFPVQVVGFEKVMPPAASDPKRDAALKKWTEYKARQPVTPAAGVAPMAARAPIPAEGAAKPGDTNRP